MSNEAESALLQKVADYGKKALFDGLNSGLAWDEVVFALGLASQMLAEAASAHGDGPRVDCLALARQRFEQGLAHPIVVIPEDSVRH